MLAAMSTSAKASRSSLCREMVTLVDHRRSSALQYRQPSECTESEDDDDGRVPEPFLLLDISGSLYRLATAALHPRPASHTRLRKLVGATHAQRLGIADGFVAESGAYFFARPRGLFDAVLDFECGRELHCPPDVCPWRFRAELDYWGLGGAPIAPCCAALDDALRRAPTPVNLFPIHTESSKSPDWQRRLWEVFEGGGTLPSRTMALISVAFILCSVLIIILGSLPALQDRQGEPSAGLEAAEWTCMVWFTLEFVLRFVGAPCKLAFLKDVCNIIDIVALLPFFIELAIKLTGVDSELSGWMGALVMMRVLRVLRIIRLFKLARYSVALQNFGNTMQASFKELSTLIMLLAIAVVFFSTVVYTLEKDVPGTKFLSIPAAFWWAVVTMTTVGYGDVVPVTFGGKLVASFASISGVLVLAIPVAMIAENFAANYRKVPVDNYSRKDSGAAISLHATHFSSL